MYFEKPLPYSSTIDNVSEFYRWKQVRKKLIKEIGPQLLSLSHDTILLIFKNWENISRNNLKSKQYSSIMNGLFHLSMVFYFHRSLAQIDDLVPTIYQNIYNKSRCICLTSAKMLKYLSKTSSDGKFNFFHEFFSSSQMSFDIKSPLLFPALVILNEVDSLTPMAVRSIVLPHFRSFISFLSSEDVEIQNKAVSILSHHITGAIEQFGNLPLFSICLSNLTNKTQTQTRGSLKLIKILLKFDMESDQISQVIDVFSLQYLTSRNSQILKLCFEIIIEMFNQNTVSITHEQISTLINSFISCIKKNSEQSIVDQFYQLLNVIPDYLFPKNEIIDFITNIFNAHLKIFLPIAYYLSYMIIKRFPNTQVSILYDPTFSKYFCKLLKLRPSLVIENQKKLHQFFENGIPSNLPEDQIYSRLKVAQACGVFIWESTQSHIDQISLFCSSENERIRQGAIKFLSQFDDQFQFIISQALFDPSPKVRLVSLRHIKNHDVLLTNNLLPTLLADESTMVLSELLVLIDELAQKNPMLFLPFLFIFFRNLQQRYLRGPSLFESSQVSTLFPKLAEILSKNDISIAKELSSFAFFVLLRGDLDFTFCDSYINKKLLNPFQWDDKADSLKTVFNLVYLPYLDICDINMLKTLEILKDFVEFDSKKFTMFTKFVKDNRSKEVIIQSLHTMTLFVPLLLNYLDETVLNCYYDLLTRVTNIQVVESILLFLGTAGVITPPAIKDSFSIYQQSEIFQLSKDKVITWLFDSLVRLIPSQPPSFFDVVTNAILLYPDLSTNYLNKLIPEFIQLLSVKPNDIIVNQLIQITKQIKNYFTPYLDKLQPILIDRLDNMHIGKLCCVLSFVLLNNFIPYAGFLYHKSVVYIQKNQNVKQLVKFMSFAVIYQFQPMDILLDLFDNINQIYPEIVIKELTRILNNTTVDSIAWITRIYLKVKNHSNSPQLLNSIIEYGHIPSSLLNSVMAKYQITYPTQTIQQKTTKKQIVIERNDIDISNNEIFNLTPPVNRNLDQWIQDLVNVVVENSPNRGIRNCRELANQSHQFRDMILLPAFLTCWTVISEKQQNEFLTIFRYIIQNFQPLPDLLFGLIDLCDSCQIELPLNLLDLALASKFPAQALHYLKCHFRKTHENIDLYLSQMVRMGLFHTARGVLYVSDKYHKIENTEKWGELLGDWSFALEKYKRQNNVVGIIRCYGNLEEWSEILKYEELFEKMTDTEKVETSLYFAQSSYAEGHIERAEYYLKYFPSQETHSHFFLKCFILVKKGEYEKVRSLVSIAQKNLANDHSMYDGTHTKLAVERLTFSQHLIELLEVVDAKVTSTIPKLWSLRQPIEERMNDSKELTDIRSLVYSNEMKLKSALKTAAVLRKQRKFQTFKGVYHRLVTIEDTPDVMFEGIKMLWSENYKTTAMTLLDLLILAYEKSSTDTLLQKYRKLDPSILIYLKKFNNDFIEKVDEYVGNYPISNELISHFKTILVNWKLQEKPHTIKRFLKYHDILKNNLCIKPNDLKTLYSFALLNVHILDLINTNTDDFALEAVRHFLKVIELSPYDNLSALLILLNILLRFANDRIMTKENMNKFLHLPSSLVSQSLPQLINLLAHQSNRLQNVVCSILLEFGSKRFQKLFYPLHIGMLSNLQRRAQKSIEIFMKLKEKEKSAADDLMLFVDSLNRAAVSILEEWKYGIEDSHRLHEKNEINASVEIIESLLQRLKEPKCNLDEQLSLTIKSIICDLPDFFHLVRNRDQISSQNRRKEKVHKYLMKNSKNEEEFEEEEEHEEPENQIISLLWIKLHRIYNKLAAKINSLASISLSTVSPQLNKLNLNIDIPGTHGKSKILSIEPNLQVLPTAYHPRILRIHDEHGYKHKFLLKGNCDVRIDYRIMQFFLLINTLLFKNRSTKNLSITQYSIVPITKNSGLISWVEKAESLHQIINKFPKNRSKEQEIIKSYSSNTTTLTSSQLFELFTLINSDNSLTAYEVDRYLWLKAPTSSIWIQNNHTFVSSSGLMSIAGYIIGLGDRHPNNILLQMDNGKIAHIDFGEVFEVTMNRSVYPEKVPFRLTRMIVNTLDGSNPYGLFEKTCIDVLSLMREAKQSICSQFNLFTIDSTIAKNLKFENAMITKRVKEKLDGKDSFWFDDVNEEENTMRIEVQVRKLIEIAQDPQRYATQYIGWCSYW